MSEMIDQYLDELETSKEDIKQSLINKGVTPTGGLTSYAEAVDSIKSNLGTATVSITKNGTQTITAEEYGYDGMSKVDVTVQVASGGSDKPQIFNGFRFTGGDIAQVDFSQYDWSLVYDTSNFFQGCTHSTGDWSNFEENFNGEILSLNYMFAGTSGQPSASVKTLPNLGNKTADVTSTNYMCYYNENLDDASSVSQWDTSRVIDATFMFGIDGSTKNYTPKITSIDLTNFGSPDGYKADYMFGACDELESVIGARPADSAIYMFRYCDKLTSIPQLDTSNVTNMKGMFSNCTSLTTIPLIDTSNVTNMSYMFYYCRSLTSIPQLNTSNATDMSYTFAYCQQLTSIPPLNTSKVTNMSYMFQNCSNLTSIPQLDTSKVTDMSYMFSACPQLTSFPEIDTSNVTSALNMFQNCYNLTTIPQLDFRSITGSVSLLCPSCTSLVEVGDINFENATYLNGVFKSCSNLTSMGDVICPNNKMFYGSYGSDCWVYGCTKLQKIGVIDCDSVTSLQYFFYNNIVKFTDLTDFGGCRNLGKASSVSNTNGSYFMDQLPNLTYESVMNVINGLYDRASAGLSVLTLKLHANHLAMLSEDDIAIATNKGWSIV